MYEVKAEKKPASLGRAVLSMICEGVCRGIGGMRRSGIFVEAKDGARELANRLSQRRRIYKKVNGRQVKSLLTSGHDNLHISSSRL